MTDGHRRGCAAYPKLRDPARAAGPDWTWLIITVHTQLRLALL
jgi:hypothetical protein